MALVINKPGTFTITIRDSRIPENGGIICIDHVESVMVLGDRIQWFAQMMRFDLNEHYTVTVENN